MVLARISYMIIYKIPLHNLHSSELQNVQIQMWNESTNTNRFWAKIR